MRSKNPVTEEGDVDDVRPQSAPIANLETGNNVSHQLHILQPQKRSQIQFQTICNWIDSH